MVFKWKVFAKEVVQHAETFVLDWHKAKRQNLRE